MGEKPLKLILKDQGGNQQHVSLPFFLITHVLDVEKKIMKSLSAFLLLFFVDKKQLLKDIQTCTFIASLLSSE